MGLWDGTSFVDVTDPTNPSVLGFLPTHTVGSSWRDIKVYKDHAFVISEAPDHGMQVYDLTQLRNSTLRPLKSVIGGTAGAVPIFEETAWYGEFGSCHNLVINEETGYAYGVGSKTCRGGLHMVDIKNPVAPVYAGCFESDGYVHDAQCVIYSGPDKKYTGKEICFCYNEDTLTIVDVSDKNTAKLLARQSYAGYQYTHQGWLLPDSSHLLLDDELDELYGDVPYTRTMLWDVTSLDAPTLKTSYFAKEKSIDHNLYTLGNKAYMSNYCSGLRILDTSGAAQSQLKEIAYFDVAPDCTTLQFLGTWSNYPYFKSGTLVVSSIDRGLFVLKENGDKTCA